jgi:hypothetical protein
MTSVPGHFTPLRLSQRQQVDLKGGCPHRVLLEADWLGARVAVPAGSARPGMRRYLMDLGLPVRDRSPRLTFKKAAYVDLGEAAETEDGCEVEIGWQSSSLAPLFPVFAGRLRLTATEITLEGFYAPPGGEVGAVLDRAFLNIAARGTARWLLEQVAAALEASRESGREEERQLGPEPRVHGAANGDEPGPGNRTAARGRATS